MKVISEQQRETIVKYSNFSTIVEHYNPDIQNVILDNKDKVFKSGVPTIKMISYIHGIRDTRLFIRSHLFKLEEFTGVKLASEVAMNELADIIVRQFGYLKITEFILFVSLFKSGKYGKFYGVFDTVVITEGLNKYSKDRFYYIDYYKEDKADEKDKFPKGYSSLSFYKAYKEAVNNNNKEFLEKYKDYINGAD